MDSRFELSPHYDQLVCPGEDFPRAKKSNYENLKRRVKELENKFIE